MTQPSPHLDLDALADALAGEQDAPAAAHLAACASCSSRLAELRAAETDVVAALAVLPPPAVPAGLSERLTAALAAEAPLAPAADRTPAPVTTLPRSSARRRPWLPVAAAGVLLLSGAGLGLSVLSGDESGDAASTAAGGTERSAADVPRVGSGTLLTASGADWADPAAGTTALPQLLEGGAPELSADGASRPAEEAADAAAQSGAAVAPALERLRDTSALASCLSAVLPDEGPEQLPLAVDYATYDGQPALAVVLPDPEPTTVSVFVVGPGCSAQDDRTLFFFRAPRP